MIEELKRLIIRDEYDLEVFNKKLETLMKKKFPEILRCVSALAIKENKFGLGINSGNHGDLSLNIYFEDEYLHIEKQIQEEFHLTNNSFKSILLNQQSLGRIGLVSRGSGNIWNAYDVQETIKKELDHTIKYLECDYYPNVQGNKISKKDSRFTYDLDYWQNLKIFVDFELEKDRVVSNHSKSFKMRISEYGPEILK